MTRNVPPDNDIKLQIAEGISAEQIRKAESTKLYKKLYKKIRKEIQISIPLVSQAVEALLKLSKSNEFNSNNPMNPNDDFIYITFTLKEVPLKSSVIPFKIPLKYPIYGPQYSNRICLLIKDQEKDIKKKIKEAGVPCLHKVMYFDTLKKSIKQYKDKRNLVNLYYLFLCDIRISKLIPNCTGQVFYRSNKNPIPVKLHGEGKDIESILTNILSNTFLIVGNGPNYSIKAARISQTQKEIIVNIISTIYRALPYILSDKISFEKVQSISIKIRNSLDLPIYNFLEKKEIQTYLKLNQKINE